jgi:hypothetical protein
VSFWWPKNDWNQRKKGALTPISLTIILSRPTGPKDDLTILAMEAAARTSDANPDEKNTILVNELIFLIK